MPRFAAPISALVICKDEADMIGDCLDSLDFCAEIVVVDSGSTDGTLDIVARYRDAGWPIRLIHNDWPGFPRQRLFALERAGQPWCLSIEADERVDPDLRQALQAAVALADARGIEGWYIRRRDWLDGYGYAHPWVLHNRLMRFFRRDKATMDTAVRVHESFEVPGRTGIVRSGTLLHRRALTVAGELRRADTYSTLKVATLMEKGVRPSLAKLVVSPFANFLKFYLLKRYVLCGRPGFVYAMMLLVYSFATEAKLFEAWKARSGT